MIKINQIKIPWKSTKKELIKKVCKSIRCKEEDIKTLEILKKSIDARNKEQILSVYSVQVQLADSLERKLIKTNKNCLFCKKNQYEFQAKGQEKMLNRPIIIGSGPCGLFAAYFLAKAGYAPLILERGKQVEDRLLDVEHFWETEDLNLESNVQFGEGGAGTFSDGKLNTLVKDPFARNDEVLRVFVEAGAPEDILYEAKPHIGTDLLIGVLKNIRKQIQSYGGEYIFCAKVNGFQKKNESLVGVTLLDGRKLSTEIAILAIGHSARDTFELLEQEGFDMSAKSFAVGFRVEHLQKKIQLNQYGLVGEQLPKASYKLATQTSQNRGVYSFCMCPGGYVINSSSEENRLVVNGMSEHLRNSKNANSAIIVSVSPDEIGRASCRERV